MVINNLLRTLSLPSDFPYTLLAHLPVGVFCDVGGGAGILSIKVKSIEPKTKIYIYEPFSNDHKFIKENLDQYNDVFFFPNAVANYTGEGNLFVHQVVEGAKSVSVGRLTQNQNEINTKKAHSVNICTLSETVSEHVRLLKIDVNGGEIDVLLGAENLYQQYGIDMIYLEFSGQKEILKWLAEHNYVVFDYDYIGIKPAGLSKNFAKLLSDMHTVNLSTGKETLTGHVQGIDRESIDGYCDWFSFAKENLGIIQTNLLCVHQSYIEEFTTALNTELATDFSIEDFAPLQVKTSAHEIRDKYVSILLSCYNGSDLIEAYMDALIDSSITNIATIIAVNFPFSHTDNAWVESQIRRFPDVKLVNIDEDISLYEAWNYGIQIAKTKYVSNLNLDDRVSKDYYQYGIQQLERFEADVFSTNYIITSEIGNWQAGKERSHVDTSRFLQTDVIAYEVSDLVLFENGRIIKKNIPHCAPIWRRAIHQEIGYFDSRHFDFVADFELWMRAAVAKKKFILSQRLKTLFFSASGTASDRIMHPENTHIIEKWQDTFPPPNYRTTHLGEYHDLLHHCLNLNVVFSSPLYRAHLAKTGQFRSYERQIRSQISSELPYIHQRFQRLTRFKNIHSGQRCILLCNGPSLNKVDFSRISSEIPLIGLNKIFLGFDRLGIELDYLVAINEKVIRQAADEYKDLPITKFISNRVEPSLIPENESTYHINTTQLPDKPNRFSEDITEYIFEGWTVTHAALQILYYMGFEEVYIVGMDHRFEQHVEGQENQAAIITGEDIDHFDPNYFGNGQQWDLPDLVNSEISYKAARSVYQLAGRQIFDVTINGACDIFTKQDIRKVYDLDSVWVQKQEVPATHPKVTIITPLFNAISFLEECVKSVQDDEIINFEHLIIDDGSTDGSYELANELAQQYKQIRLVINKNAKGVSGARNYGLKLARGEYIAFLDADDVYYRGALTKRVKALDTHPDWNVVYCATEITDENLNPLDWKLSRKNKIFTFDDISVHPIHLNAVMGRSDVFKTISFPENYKNGEDWLFTSRVLRSGYKYYPVSDCFVAYRIHNESTVMKQFIQHQLTLLNVLDIIYGQDAEVANPAPKYKSGLKSPALEDVKLHRLIQALTAALLSADETLASIVDELERYHWSNLTHHEITINIQYTIMRLYGCHRDAWQQILHEQCSAIDKQFETIAMRTRLPAYCRVMDKLCTQKSAAVSQVTAPYKPEAIQMNEPTKPNRFLQLRQYFTGGSGLLAVLAVLLQAVSLLAIPYAWLFSLLAFGVLLIMLGNSIMSMSHRVTHNMSFLQSQINQFDSMDSQIKSLKKHSNQVDTERKKQVEMLTKKAEQLDEITNRQTAQAERTQSQIDALEKRIEQLNATLHSQSQTTKKVKSDKIDSLQSQIQTLKSWIAQMQQAHESVLNQMQQAHQSELAQVQQVHQSELAQVQQAHQSELAQVQQAHQSELEQVQRTHESVLNQMQQAHQSELDQVEQAHQSELAQVQQVHQSELEQMQQTNALTLTDLQQNYQSELEATKAETQQIIAAQQTMNHVMDEVVSSLSYTVYLVEDDGEILYSNDTRVAKNRGQDKKSNIYDIHKAPEFVENLRAMLMTKNESLQFSIGLHGTPTYRIYPKQIAEQLMMVVEVFGSDADAYHYRNSPQPRPIGSGSFLELLNWLASDIAPKKPNLEINPVLHKTRNDPRYMSNLKATGVTEEDSGELLYTLTRLLKPDNVIEVGCYNGTSTITMAQALEDNQTDGMVHAIDISPEHFELTTKNVDEAGLTDRVKVYLGASDDLQLLRRIPRAKLIFVDGDHRYEGAKRDFEIYSQYLLPGGIMVYHDTIKIMALRHLMAEIAHMPQYRTFTVASSDGDGMTLIWRINMG